MAKIGFIGTGIMGHPMALNLQKAGHSLFLSAHHDAAPADLIAGGAVALANPKEVAQEAEFIIVMVPDTPQVDDVLFRADGVAAGVGKGKVVIDMSSISPTATKAFAAKINEKGAQYLDAPVSGGEVGAKAATLSIMVGGEADAFERVLPLFQAMGKNITLVGGNGDGQTAKVANQIIVALNIQAVAEALLFASKNGADPAKVREALMGGFASSKILEVHGERTDQRHLRSRLPHQPAPEGPEPGSGRCTRAGHQPAEHRQHPASVQHLRGHRRQQLGPLGADQGPGTHGEFLDSR
jgi:3-hydroxyisobutyrate dehydrogenase and related beta-hydroxyacid dehydrogenases